MVRYAALAPAEAKKKMITRATIWVAAFGDGRRAFALFGSQGAGFGYSR